MICLPKELTKKFLSALKDGTINPDKLSEMSSEERRTVFEGIVGDSAKQVNALFESKLLLKDQQAGMITWAKEVAGLKPEIRRDILSRIENIKEVLTPEQEKSFLEDLASKKLGIDVSMEEAKKIADFAKAASEAKKSISTGGDRMEYGRASVKMTNYINELKESNKPSILETAKNQGIVKSTKQAVETTAGTAKSMKATLDDSYIGHQGMKMMWSHPTIWFKNAVSSFANAAKVLGGQEVMNEVRADIVSRPHYIDGTYKKMGLAVDSVEEQFPGNILENAPGIGRVLKAADVAYTAQAYTSRADAADLYLKIAERDGIDITDKKQLASIGKMVNSLTGRGSLGGLEPVADKVNLAFFALRYLKSNFDTLTAHQLQGDVTPFVRKQAATNLLKIVGGTMGVLAVANALKPGSVEKDPRSSDFGKIRVGDTRFDVSGGMGAIITLATRLLTESTKSSITQKISPLNSGKFGSPTGSGIIGDFFGNKVSPLISLMSDLVNRMDRNGNKITVGGEASNFLEPLPIANFLELKNNPNSANILAATILDGLGIVANTYSTPIKKK